MDKKTRNSKEVVYDPVCYRIFLSDKKPEADKIIGDVDCQEETPDSTVETADSAINERHYDVITFFFKTHKFQ